MDEASKIARALCDRDDTTTEEALALFDALEPVGLEFMLGRWRGSGLQTSHPLDGWLEATNWYGKEFVDPETVHPLLFSDAWGNIVKVAPNALLLDWALQLPCPKSKGFGPIFGVTPHLLRTWTGQARLRLMDYRGKVSATMIYDRLPINDAFRKLSDRAVLGVMDFKAVPQPFFFRLERCAAE